MKILVNGPVILTAAVIDLDDNETENNFGGFADYTTWHVASVHSGGSTTITGILAAATEGQRLVVWNFEGGGGTVVFKHQDTNSDAANRLVLDGAGDVTLENDGRIEFEYAESRWRQI